eukprot:TRINITY_DN23219_c0_g1_i2.p2 TRINITY_DN23219_c0_g1~~TRINITY_DN23219_c0_g1_i2.p2  ORF type:complete len:159 (+),score=49.72 TRINITY_DN23219_c0_g1_i2:180-656(+)
MSQQGRRSQPTRQDKRNNGSQQQQRQRDDDKTLFPNGSTGGPETSALVEEIDKKQLVVLRDNRIFVGVLRSYDQFANIVLEHTYERLYVGPKFGEISVGLFIIRGENVMMLGRVDEEAEAELEAKNRISMEDMLQLRQENEESTAESTKRQQVEFDMY